MHSGVSGASLTRLANDVASDGAEVVPFEVPGLGNRTYIAVAAATAALIDPPRDIDSLLGFVGDSGWTVSHVLETHVHNDYVSGGLAAARRTGAEYVVPRGGGVTCPARHVEDGEELTLGSGALRAIHTPGHTPHHMSYVLHDGRRDVAVFSGGGLLYGGVGRTDLFGTEFAEELALAQWHSARRLSTQAQERAIVMPTHGFGSFCSVGDSHVLDRSLSGLMASNPVFLEDAPAFTRALLQQQGPYPAYFARMASLNTVGSPRNDPPVPPLTTLASMLDRAAAGEWVLDLRHGHAFDEAHVPGSLSFDAAGAYVTYAGWLIPWDAPLHVIVPDEATLSTAVTELGRIGIDRVASAALWRDGTLDPGRYAAVRHADGRRLREALAGEPDLPVLDVRLESEWAQGTLEGQRGIPLHVLHERLEEVRDWSGGREVWVYCASGFRSAVAASLLQRAGIPAVHVDDRVVGV